jgi:hypothetical protein
VCVTDLIQFDRSIVAWLQSNPADIDKLIAQHRKEVVRSTTKALAQENFASLVDGIADALECLEGHERSSAIIQLFTKLTGRDKGAGALFKASTSPTLSHRLPTLPTAMARLDLNSIDASSDTSHQWSVAQVLRSVMDG